MDPYGVIHGDMSQQKIDCNQRYLKVKHIINNTTKYHNFLFGSSRVANIDTRTIKGAPWYNMTYSEGLPLEHLEDIKMFINNGVKIKHIAIGLDEIAYSINPKRHENEVLRKPYINSIKPYYQYLILKPNLKIYNKIKAQGDKDFYAFYDIYNSGIPLIRSQKSDLQINSEQHINSELFNTPHTEKYYCNQVNQTIHTIKSIVQICKKNQIKLTLFVNPIHHTTYQFLDKKYFYSFIKQLSNIHPFYDFSGLNTITVNNANYYEPCHYIKYVGNQMIPILFDASRKKEDGFGQLVTSQTIDAVIQKKKKEIQNYNK